MELLEITNTLFVGKVAIRLPEVDSTNRFAKELVSKSTPSEGTVVWADYQTAGRGQIGSSWQSEPGANLLMSCILYPKFLPANRLFALNQAVCLAVLDTIQPLLPPLSRACVKWPNDLYIDEQKTAGVLIENRLQGFFVEHAVVGIGLNVLQTRFDATLPNPTSLVLKNPEKNFSIPDILSQLCTCLERRYMDLRAERYNLLHQDYLERLYRRDEKAHLFKICATNEILKAQIVDVNQSGNLILLDSICEKKHTFAFKEVVFL